MPKTTMILERARAAPATKPPILGTLTLPSGAAPSQPMAPPATPPKPPAAKAEPAPSPPPAAAEPAAPATPSKARRRAMQAVRLRERLTEAYPAAFNPLAPVPLALHVDREIRTALGVAYRLLGATMSRWTGRVDYLAAVAAPGSRRFNLDGSDAGEVSDEHRAHAAERLAEKQAAQQQAPAA